MASTLPDYYTLLGLDDKRCTTEAIRAAYKRESLRSVFIYERKTLWS
jgi:hypothetical protein